MFHSDTVTYSVMLPVTSSKIVHVKRHEGSCKSRPCLLNDNMSYRSLKELYDNWQVESALGLTNRITVRYEKNPSRQNRMWNFEQTPKDFLFKN